MQAQLIKDMPMEEYHARRDLLSKSMLSVFADCPARYKWQILDGNEKPKTKSLRLGNAVHTLALEPELWRTGYHVLPSTYFNKKGEESKWIHNESWDYVKEQIVLAGDKMIIKAEEYQKAEQMAEALTKNSYAVSLLKQPGYVEASIMWDRFKCRPDFLANEGYAVDLKIARSVRPDIFFSDSYNFKYFLSVALTGKGYEAMHGKPLDNYIFVCIEEDAPYFVECYETIKPMNDMAGMNYLDYGNQEFDKLLSRFDECAAFNIWPQYQEKIGTMRLPGHAMKKLIGKGE